MLPIREGIQKEVAMLHDNDNRKKHDNEKNNCFNNKSNDNKSNNDDVFDDEKSKAMSFGG